MKIGIGLFIYFALVFLWWLVWSLGDYGMSELVIGIAAILVFVSMVCFKPISLFIALWFFGLYALYAVDSLSVFLWSYLIGSLLLFCIVSSLVLVRSCYRKLTRDQLDIEVDFLYGDRNENNNKMGGKFLDRKYESSTDPVSIWRE